MTQDTKKKKLIINKLTTQQYLDALDDDLINDDELYMTTDAPIVADVKVGNQSVVNNGIASLGSMALETAANYSTKAVADTLYADIEVETTKVDKVSTANKVYGTDSTGAQTTYDVDSFGQVDDVQVGGSSVVANKIASLGTMASRNSTDYRTASAQDTIDATKLNISDFNTFTSTLGTMAEEDKDDYYTKVTADATFADITYEDTVDNHIANTSNPHQVTKAQVGLGNVDNTSDADKPVSTAQQTALDGKVDKTGTANQVYGTSTADTQTTLTYSKTATANTIAQRDTDGVLNVGAPTADTNAATKKYVDDQDALKVDKTGTANQVYGTGAANTQTTLTYDKTATANTIVQRDTNGVVKVGTASADTDAVNKKYFNDNVGTATQTALSDKVDVSPLASIVYGTDSTTAATTYNVSDLTNLVDDVTVGGTSVVTNKVAVLGTMAGESASDYATATALSQEVTRATDRESALNTKIETETTRASGVEAGLQSSKADKSTTYTKTEIDGMLSGAMHFKGSVATVADLPSSGNTVGDMYTVTSTGANYAWDGTQWVKMSETVDLSDYALTSYVNTQDQAEITRATTAEATKVDKVSTPSRVYGTDEHGNQITYGTALFGNIDDVTVGGTSVVSNRVAPLGSMAGETASDYSTKAVADTLYAAKSLETTVSNHTSNTSNPHQVTKAQVGLGNVDNTADLDKPISTATQTALDSKADSATTLSGYGITDAYTKTEIDGKLSGAMHFKGTVATVADLPSSGQQVGDMYNVTASGANYAWDGSVWDKLSENVDLSGIYTKTEVDTLLDGKEDTISDLATIRSGAALGATALQPNTAITAATHTKITYDANGLVTSGTDLSASDIPSLTLSKISDITATSSEVNVLDGITASTTELNYVDGVTSNIQTQLDAKQETLVSGTNIKTVGGNSLLGSGNIDFPTVDQTYDATSSNAQSGIAIANAISEKANTSDLATVATSGSYNDLSDKPSIPSAQVNSDWDATSGVAQILNKPTIPTVNNATLTIQANGTNVATFTANASSDVTANITIPDSATWGNISGTLSDQTDLNTALNSKQSTLVSGTNIKTVNGTSILGSGDLTTGQKHIGGTQPLSGAALLANQLVYINANKVYPSTNETLSIEPSFGLQLCSSAISNNTEVTSDKLLQKASVIDLTNIPHDTLEKGDPCYFRCILNNSMIQSDNYVATSMLAGYTWYYIGIAQSSTAINFDTTQSFFITLNSSGKITHINGKEVGGSGSGGSSSKRVVETFTATANQTTFTVTEQIINKDYVSVNVDNVELTSAAYSLSNDGMSVILGTGVAAGAKVDIKYFSDITLADSGATFTPTVSKSGYTTTMSWSNDRSLPNPSTVTITDGVIYTPSQTKSGTAAVISWTNNQGKTNPSSVTLYDGVTFTPSVTVNQAAQQATLSWTNDGGKTNPDPLTIYLGQDNTTQRLIDRFTATANQTTFVATHDILGKNVLSVNVDNSELLNDGFTLANDKRTVTLNDACAAGAIVELKYFHNLIMAQDGNTYTPHVSKSGYTTTLSWTNDAELENPSNVNILDGVIWTPAVTATTGGYNLSWTNDQGKTNPSTVFINGIYPAGVWASASTYKPGYMVTYEDTNYQYGYIAKQNVPAGTSLTNTTYWMQAYAIGKTYIAATVVDWGE